MGQLSERSGGPEAPVSSGEAVSAIPPRRMKQAGFLPIETNTFDRCFISVVCFIAIHLLWMRFLEAALPLGIATALSIILAVIIVRRG
jgi:predicted small integral membrane protein